MNRVAFQNSPNNRLMLFALCFISCSAYAQNLETNYEERPHPPQNKYDSRNFVKVSVLQWAPAKVTPIGVTPSEAEAFKHKNRLTLADFAKTAKDNGAEFMVTPELSVIAYPEDDYASAADVAPYAETIPGPTTEYFSQVSKNLKMYLQVGFAEKDKNNILYNATVVLDPSGQIVAKYRKINLFAGERNYFSAGKDLASFAGPFGVIGIIICADIYNRYPMQAYKNMGIQSISMGASWTISNPMTWFQSAARNYEFNVLASNHPYFPDSGVIDAAGYIQSHIHTSQGLAYGYLPRIRK